ncbi:MAG TPA: phenylalanine--tRNA ligase subunit alpha, partial [Acidobacteriaceae bacterium]
MNESIPPLSSYDESSLDSAFAVLADEVRAETAASVDVEAFRLRWLGRKQGRLKLVSDAWLKAAPPEARKPLGMRFNDLKQRIEAALEQIAATPGAPKAGAGVDITLPGIVRTPGIEHPLVRTMNEIVRVFHQLGYSTALGPEVETDFYNFEALNFPPNHPARDTQDTLIVAGQGSKPLRERLLMRTHTSPVQIRTMVEQGPPLRIVVPGKVHRNDAADATHSPVFHQVEGLCVDTN